MLQEHFKELRDPRQTSKVRYPLLEIIMVVICGVIAGCEGWDDTADFASAKEEKSNEITAVPTLLRMLDVEGAIVTADAMSCQREIVRVATERKADYVIGLKENQPMLYQEAVQCFQEVMQRPQLYVQPKQIITHDKGHGRKPSRLWYDAYQSPVCSWSDRGNSLLYHFLDRCNAVCQGGTPSLGC